MYVCLSGITNGVWADFFTVAVRTGGPGMGGVSMLLIERSMGGITTKQMKCQGVWSSGTTYAPSTSSMCRCRCATRLHNPSLISFALSVSLCAVQVHHVRGREGSGQPPDR